MASSSSPCTGQDGPVAPPVTASGTGVLPADAMYEILLRVPAKALCRMRAVSRPWRRLLSDPLFAAAHAARRREPLFISSSYNAHESFVDIIDLSGQIVKRVRLNKDDRVLIIPQDLVFTYNFQIWLGRVINPATGAAQLLPYYLAEEHTARGLHRYDYFEEDQLMGGQVASTGEYKVLRMLSPLRVGVPQLCEIYTLGSSRDGDARWRGKQPPPDHFMMEDWNSVVIGGVAYLSKLNAHRGLALLNQAIKQDWIMSFHLEEEEWGTNIRGPQINFHDNNGAAMFNQSTRMQPTLANLNGSLAVVHGPDNFINVWILKDIQKCLWVKQYSLQVEPHREFYHVQPLFVLEDGRIVIHKDGTGLLQSYDPRTNTYTNLVDSYLYSAINIYTGNLLTLE